MFLETRLRSFTNPFSDIDVDTVDDATNSDTKQKEDELERIDVKFETNRFRIEDGSNQFSFGRCESRSNHHSQDLVLAIVSSLQHLGAAK